MSGELVAEPNRICGSRAILERRGDLKGVSLFGLDGMFSAVGSSSACADISFFSSIARTGSCRSSSSMSDVCLRQMVL